MLHYKCSRGKQLSETHQLCTLEGNTCWGFGYPRGRRSERRTEELVFCEEGRKTMKSLPLMLASALVVTGWTSGAYAQSRGSAGAFSAAQLEQLKQQTHVTKTPNGAKSLAQAFWRWSTLNGVLRQQNLGTY